MHKPKNPRPAGAPPKGPSPVRGRGRPRVFEGESKQIAFRVSVDLHDRMTAHAKAHRLPLSHMCRLAILEVYFKDDPPIFPPTPEERIEVLEAEVAHLLKVIGSEDG